MLPGLPLASSPPASALAGWAHPYSLRLIPKNSSPTAYTVPSIASMPRINPSTPVGPPGLTAIVGLDHDSLVSSHPSAAPVTESHCGEELILYPVVAPSLSHVVPKSLLLGKEPNPDDKIPEPLTTAMSVNSVAAGSV